MIVGDIHGQYFDLCHMLGKAGSPDQINYLFLGDYVDRGIYGLEVMILLMSIKLSYPQRCVLLRGNHESRSMTENFTFRSEILEAYDEQVYEMFLDVFNALPLACIIDEKYLAMHGGISPDISKIEEINQIDRFQEVPLEGVFCDLLWSDPMKDEDAKRGTFHKNSERDCSYYFGKKPLKKLLDNNDLMSIVRGHQVQVEGFKMHKWDGDQSFPYVITIFSAPNYCGYYYNKAAVLVMEEGNLSLKQYEESEVPYRLPDNMDVFTWSVPFLVEKVLGMISNILIKVGNDDEEDGDIKVQFS